MGVGVELLDSNRLEVARDIRNVLVAAYRVEADLIGVANFPPLCRTAEEIVRASARFFGAWLTGQLAGVLELEEPSTGPANIASLVVRPDCFRRGIGTRLVQHAIDELGERSLAVSTGTRNRPALLLYERLGFQELRRWLAPGEIPVVRLLRDASASQR